MISTIARRFGLGKALILAAALLTGGGAAAAYRYQAPHTRAIAGLNARGALVLSYSPRESQPLEAWLPYDRWLPHEGYIVNFGLSLGYCGTGLCYSSAPLSDSQPLTDDDLALLRDLPSARSLVLHGQPIGDAGLEHLRGHPGISDLVLTDTRVTAASIDLLASLPKLRSVSLPKAAFNKAAAARLAAARPDLHIRCA